MLRQQTMNNDSIAPHQQEVFKPLNNESDLTCVSLSSNCSFHFPSNITQLVWRSSFLYTELSKLHVCGAERLLYLDLSMNLIYRWHGPITGFENLRYLNLSTNICSNISDTFFGGFKSLEILDISNNKLGFSFDFDKNNHSHLILQNLTKLEFLDMSYNKITKLHTETFSSLVNLRELRLESNMLNEWSFDLNNSRCLTVLDLAGNKLDSLPPSAMDYLDWLTHQDCNLNKNVTLNISMNSVICSCDDLHFLKWIKNTNVQVHFREADGCRMNGRKYVLLTEKDFMDLLEILEDDCKDRTWITYLECAGGLVAGVMLAGIVFLLVYQKRWKLRYLYYGRNRRHRHTGYEHIFAHDAMISYAKSRAQFVKDSLFPAMKSRGLDLWLADKDSRVGVSIAENSTHAIVNSRKTVILVDGDYLKDSWCDYEMNMALVESVESQRRLIIVVLLEKLDIEKLPITILRFLRSERSLEFPENTQDLDTFWTNLANEIDT